MEVRGDDVSSSRRALSASVSMMATLSSPAALSRRGVCTRSDFLIIVTRLDERHDDATRRPEIIRHNNDRDHILNSGRTEYYTGTTKRRTLSVAEISSSFRRCPLFRGGSVGLGWIRFG